MNDNELQFDLKALKRLLRQLEEAPDAIIPCTETFRLLDEYVDRMVQGEPIAELMPQVRYHLDLCPDCGQRFELLLRAIEESIG